MDLNHANFYEVGIDAFGQRCKILNEVTQQKRGKYVIVYILK